MRPARPPRPRRAQVAGLQHGRQAGLERQSIRRVRAALGIAAVAGTIGRYARALFQERRCADRAVCSCPAALLALALVGQPATTDPTPRPRRRRRRRSPRPSPAPSTLNGAATPRFTATAGGHGHRDDHRRRPGRGVVPRLSAGHVERRRCARPSSRTTRGTQASVLTAVTSAPQPLRPHLRPDGQLTAARHLHGHGRASVDV